MRSAMSDFIETNNFNKFSLDLNLEERGSLCLFLLQISVRHFGFLHPSRNFKLVSSNPKISWSGEEYGLQGRQYRTTFHITRSQADVRRIVLIAFVIMGIIIKGEEVLILPFVPTHPAPSLTFPRARKRSIECGPPNRKWNWCFSRCRCLLLNKSSYGICRSRQDF